MPSKKKKYNARFPAGRIKKIMQTDEEVGKVAQAVPVIISRTLELFVESLLTKSMHITLSRSAKTLTPSHMKQCILSESRFDFLKDLVKNVPDASVQEDNENNEAIDYTTHRNADEEEKPDDGAEIAANFYTEQSTSGATVRTPVIQYSPKLTATEQTGAEVPKLSFSVENLVRTTEPKIHIDLSASASYNPLAVTDFVSTPKVHTDVPPLIPIPSNYGPNTSDNLYIDEDYDN